jgi:hypothetical protein
MKVVINTEFGGFGLSSDAIEKILYLKNIEWEKQEDEYEYVTYYELGHLDSVDHILQTDWKRQDPDLVSVVEELGKLANARFSDLVVIEIPDNIDWYISCYDGIEHVAEVHKTWYAPNSYNL